MNDRGAALVAVVWLLALFGGVVGTVLVDLRTDLTATANRVEGVRVQWQALGCLARLRHEVDRALRGGDRSLWRHLEQVRAVGCDFVVAPPTGMPLDINVMSLDHLRDIAGLDTDIADQVIRRRGQGVRVRDFGDVMRLLDPAAHRRLPTRTHRLDGVVTFEPSGWSVTALGAVSELWVTVDERVSVAGRTLQ